MNKGTLTLLSSLMLTGGLIATGCGGGSSNDYNNIGGTTTGGVITTTTTGTTSGGGGVTTTTGTVSTSGNVELPAKASAAVTGVVPAGTPGASVATAYAPRGLVEFALSLISSPAQAAAGDNVLANFTVTAYNNKGVAVATATSDSTGKGNFANLEPGTYRFVFTSTAFPNTTIQTLVPLASGASGGGVADPSTTAATLVALAAAGGGDLSGIDVSAFFQEVLSNPDFQAVANSITAALQSGQPFVNADGSPSASLQAQVTAAENSVLVVTKRAPAEEEQGVARSNTAFYLTFSQPMDASTVPPAYNGWQVTHTSPSTGVTETATPENINAYGAWTYSDNARTLSNGVQVPANTLAFVTNKTMAAGKKEVFNWTFNALPKSKSGATLTTSASPGQLQTWTLYTAP